MNFIHQVPRIAAALACICMSTSLLQTTAYAQDEYSLRTQDIIVRCDRGETVQENLDRFGAYKWLQFYLVGTCPGFTLMRDGVSVAPLYDEVCPGAEVAGRIVIDGARRIALRCLTVTGMEGAVYMSGGKASLEDVQISGSDDVGVEIRDGGTVEMIGGSVTDHAEGVSLEAGFAQFEDTDISNNGSNGVSVANNSYFELSGGSITNNIGSGIDSGFSSVVVLNGTTVSNNGSTGVRVKRGSQAVIEGNAMILGNGGRGISIVRVSEATIRDAKIENNSSHGLFISSNSNVNILGSTIANNIENGILVRRHSWALVNNDQIFSNTLDGIAIETDSGVLIRGFATSILDPISCDGDESSIRNESPAVIIVNCDDPDF